MITKFDISGFKRFRKQKFDLAPLTTLTGLNGSGKTSLIHAILVAWESLVGHEGNVVRLNGPFQMELGTAEDVKNWDTDEVIEFDICTLSGAELKWKFGVPLDDALYLAIDAKPDTSQVVSFSGQSRAFTYLSAERLGPRGVLGSSPLPAEELEVGVRGEHCAQILAILGDKPIEDKSRLHPSREENASPLLKYEVERWLGEIARPVEINAERYPGATVTALRFRSPGGDWVHAPNMGFGVSYALPVILAGLTALPGGLIIVENPEAHLHPAGQSRMGVFLAWLAGRGVQVILETHSDHVLNGIRRAIGEHGYLRSDRAIVHFFESGESEEPVVHQLGFTPVGGITHWPKGFFDQYQIDVSSLGRIRRGR